MEIGKVILRIRNIRNMTQKQLAELVNCDESTISNIESNNRQPSLNLLKEIAKALQCPLSIIAFLSEHEVKEINKEQIDSLQDTIYKLLY